ncbi:MAG: polysaccharide biosynthesis/export family protein [Chitinophagales bacterium]
MSGVLVLLTILSLNSCGVLFPNKMFKTPDDYPFAELTEPSINYKIVPGDILEVYVFSNKGDKLIDPILVSSGITATEANPVTLIYEIDSSGNVNLPVLGIVKLGDKTDIEAAQYLQGLYQNHYISPYVNLQITNKRVIVYRGNMNAEVVPLTNKNMTIAEAIAIAGGVTPTGKTKEIKVIREHEDTLQVSVIDLSTIEGIKAVSKKVQPNDIIYIEPTINTEYVKEIAPIISTLTSLVLVYIYISNLKNP